LGVPTFVVTHTVPQEWVYEGSPFTFVTDGVESAVEQAKAVAGDKDVAVGAASIARQCIGAGLLDGIQVDLTPVLLGDGVRLFDHLGTKSIELQSTRVIEGAGVTHLTFRVVKRGSKQTGRHAPSLEALYPLSLTEGVFSEVRIRRCEQGGASLPVKPIGDHG
jgi:dihydrofolate reductase